MPTSTPELVDVVERPTAVIRARVPVHELVALFDRAFREVSETLGRQGVPPVGAAFARYAGPPTDVADLEVGFPTATPITDEGDVVASTLPGGRVARTILAGPYDELGAAWAALAAWMAEHGHIPGDAFWETYVTEPRPDMDPADLRTELYWSVR